MFARQLVIMPADGIQRFSSLSMRFGLASSPSRMMLSKPKYMYFYARSCGALQASDCSGARSDSRLAILSCSGPSMPFRLSGSHIWR